VSYSEIATVGIQKQDTFPRKDIHFLDVTQSTSGLSSVCVVFGKNERTQRVDVSYSEIATVGIQKQDAFPRKDIHFLDVTQSTSGLSSACVVFGKK